MPDLAHIQALVIDLDGVLWRGQTALPGVVEFFNLLQERKIPFVLATNNAAASPEKVCRRLQRMGIHVSTEEILTSGRASAEYLRTELSVGSSIYAIGEEPLKTALVQAGFSLTQDASGVRAVVVGLDRQSTWEQLAEAALAIQTGALFLGTNPDVTFPIERGQVPGNGAILAALEAATGVKPRIIGKPEPHLYLQAVAYLQTESNHALAVGDRLETDILGGQRAGMMTALILTGVTQRHELGSSPIQPDYVFDDLPQLTRALMGHILD
ncbi:MAG TPA: HAD-IIA family hydrolase [Anaerolineae bacterium]|nr:HAD-IIA family hydrolase [Anaerolineae bacterium]